MSLTRNDPDYLTLKAKGHRSVKILASQGVQMLDIIIDLTAANEALLEALKPFAEGATHLHPSTPDSAETLDCMKVGDWRRAYRAYNAHASEGRKL